ncbi:MAG: Phage protein Gp37/Gp68 [Spirochaetes bacterium ADurb.Bin110]|jgi:protein gp37|nr:MAG: Phage protein Gp37/Gp68 [Spirochaetes bacterium ADurb.Bin110]HNV36002.1 DUF5131 family protein [Rectinema sp.]
MGVTVESEAYAHRIELLKKILMAVKFISFEPLLSEIDASHSLQGIDWIIVGGESGTNARPMKAEGDRGLQKMAQTYNAAFFFKQWGGTNKKKAGRILDGREWNAMPQTKVFCNS